MKYSNKKIVVLEKNSVTPAGDISLEMIENLGDVTIYDSVPAGKLEDVVKDAEAVICSKAKFTESLHLICSTCTTSSGRFCARFGESCP